MVQVYVPEGDLDIGWVVDSDLDALDNEKPSHRVYLDNEKPGYRVYLDAFWIDQTEVTNAQYAQCVADGACEPPRSNSSHTRESYYGNAEFNNYPVVNVSWHDANAYCEWAERRLPTGVQWEKAASSADGRKWPWGNEPPNDTLANFDRNVGDTTPVGNYPAGASPYGAYDMAGNVWEWVERFPPKNHVGPLKTLGQVVRGGSWVHSASVIRVGIRERDFAINRVVTVGFRCISLS